MSLRFQFSLKTTLWVMASLLLAGAAVVAFVWVRDFEATMGRSYDEFRRAADQARAQGKDLSFSEWQREKEGRGAAPATQE